MSAEDRPGGASPEQKEFEGQKWEYLFVSCDFDKMFRPRYINGEEIKEWKKESSIYEYSNNLGEQRWELIGPPDISIGAPGFDQGYKLNLVFKRSKT